MSYNSEIKVLPDGQRLRFKRHTFTNKRTTKSVIIIRLGQKNKIKESTAEKWNGNLRENYIIIKHG
jgi:hypothetical protein